LGSRGVLLVGAPDWVTLAAFADGLHRVGRTCFWGAHGAVDLDALNPSALVIDGMRAGGRAVVAQARARGIPAICIDNGFLRRVHTAADHDHGHFYVGFGGLGWFPKVAPSPDRLNALNLRVGEPVARSDGPALVCGQVPGDASHGLSGELLAEVYRKLVVQLAESGVADVVFRPHPLGFIPPPPGAECRPAGAESLEAAIAGARFVVSLNSNAGLDALIAGVPAVTLLPSHYSRLAYSWPVNPRAIRPPDPDEVRAHCERLAWAQWTLAEMRAGLPQRWFLDQGWIT
jgi:hypothetical protein